MGNTIGTPADTPHHHHHGVIKKRLLRWENSSFSQRIEKLPSNTTNNGGGAELRTTSNNYNNNNNSNNNSNNNNATSESTQRKIQQLESQLHTDTNNLKLYSIFGALLTFIGFILSIVGPVMSCSFGIITWSEDGDNNDNNNDGTTAASTNNNYQSKITNVGLFTWYNPTTSSCDAYSPLDTEYFYVDGTARGMAIASLFFGGCALLWILGRLVTIFILQKSDTNDSGDSNNSSGNNGSIKLRVRITFLSLAGLTLLASITQISTLSYFLTKKNEGNNNFLITCTNDRMNGKNNGNYCSKGIGAHDAIISFLFYFLGGVVYIIAAMKCCIQGNNTEKNSRSKRRFNKKRGGGKKGEEDEELYESTIDVHKCTSASCYCNNGGLENVSFIPVAAASSNDTKKSGDELTRQAKMAATTTGVGSTTAANTVNKEYEYWYPEASRISDEGSAI